MSSKWDEAAYERSIAQGHRALAQLTMFRRLNPAYATLLIVLLAAVVAALVSLWAWYGARAQDAANVAYVEKVRKTERLLLNTYGAIYGSDSRSVFIKFSSNIRVYGSICENQPCARFYAQ